MANPLRILTVDSGLSTVDRLSLRALQPLLLLLLLQSFHKLVDFPHQNVLQAIQCQADSVVGHPALGVVVGSDLFRAVPATYHAFSLLGDLGGLLFGGFV